MATMHACVLHGVNDLRYERVDIPTLQPGEVLVKVRAVGICGSDIPRIFTTGTYHFPTIPGHEFAGEVVAAADPENEKLIGTRAAVFPLIPCRACNSCQTGAYELCKHYNYIGSRCDGAFAEYVAAPAWNLAPIPDNLPFDQAAMTEPVAVSLHALRQSKLEIGDTVVVFGAGTIGMLIAQWARAWGASKVMLVGTSRTNFRLAKEALGFEYVCNSGEHDTTQWVNSITRDAGADIAIEAAGSPVAFCNCLNCIRPGGKIVAVGNPRGDYNLPKDTYWQILRKQAIVYGTWNSSFDNSIKNDWSISIEAMAAGKIQAQKLITHRFSLDQLPQALDTMRNPAEYSSKVMIELG